MLTAYLKYNSLYEWMRFKYDRAGLLIVVLSLYQGTHALASDDTANQETKRLTSQQLVSAVLFANPQLKIAQSAWDASLTRIDQTSSFDDPIFSYTTAPLTINSNRSDYGQRIEISQKLPWAGKLTLRSQEAEYQADAVNHNIVGLQLKLSIATKIFFIDWYYIHQAIKINQQNQALLQEFKEITVSRYSTGLASKQDALRAEMELALLEHQAIVLMRQQRAIQTHINTLLNKQPDSPLARPVGLDDLQVLPSINDLQDQALQYRPELKTLIATSKAAKMHFELAEKDSYPDITFKAGYNSLWKDSDKHFTVGIAVNVPLFQGKYKAAENEALAQIKKIEWQRIDFIAKLKEDIHISYDKVVESMHVLTLYRKKLIPLANEVVKAEKSAYQAGEGDFLSLIDSEKKQMHILLQTEQALADTHRHIARLENAVGLIQFPTKPLAEVEQ